ncbi:MAG: TetR/AcrR family transcriptional regulator [Treponema sp.]|nr:TetR/AcrR family transcriptional regulator [Treponema sp.]
MARSKDEGIVDRILDSAFVVFGEEGFQGTTVRQVAARAGLSAGSIYNYFSDKDTLFEAAVGRGWGRFIEELEAIIAATPGREERIAALIGSGFLSLERAFPLVRGMLFEASRRHLLGPRLDQVCDTIDRLLVPDEGSAEMGGRIEPESARKAFIRIIILGILATAATESSSAGPALTKLRQTIETFLSTFIGRLPASPSRKDVA